MLKLNVLEFFIESYSNFNDTSLRNVKTNDFTLLALVAISVYPTFPLLKTVLLKKVERSLQLVLHFESSHVKHVLCLQLI